MRATLSSVLFCVCTSLVSESASLHHGFENGCFQWSQVPVEGVQSSCDRKVPEQVAPRRAAAGD